ncbi:hypothetical protein SKAU_G00280720 [Synaphobranchus kaupii]|uniref:Gypsy retrotransposon integrase-like protein 1 n=1 Tax=Synaphobranchus kaupii TaxID=118154 RepID=A0A9Q1EX10_SYNKA|nr:hypothetical protein SKAU_G00280720 [Synaphobranchus kaupii]
MEFSLPPLSPFLALTGEPPIPWIRWQESFETFIAAVGLEEANDSRKRALLIHNLGSEGQRIFRTFGPAPTYAECVTKLSGHFAAPQSVMFRRIVFRQRRQQTGESLHHYVADLRSLASLCKFGALEEELIRDQLAEHTNNPKFREKLLMSPDDLSLAKAVEIAFQIECAASLASQLAPSSPFPSQPMLLTQTVAPCTESQDSLEVNFAGRQGATARQTCAPTTIHSVSATSRPFKWCTVELDGVCLPLLLDTAASKSLLNVSTVRRLFPLRTFKADAEDLYGYGHNKIGMVGTITFSVRYGTKALPSFTFQVSRQGANLLGFDLFCALGFSVMDNTGSAILSVGHSPWQQRWPSLFNGLGCLTAFNHQPLLSPEVRPVIQPLRRLPLALRDDVTRRTAQALGGGHHRAARRLTMDFQPVEELSAKFYGSTLFTKLDLRQGYLQVPLHPDSRFLTAFVTHVGVFRYTRMPFGLSSAPSCFQKIMATIFAGIPGVVIYLDDIVVHGATPAVHDERLARVLDVLASHNLTLNGEKCIFAVPAIEFVGFRVTADGLSPLHSNVEAVLNLPEPSCPAQLASFLGMTAYYLRFLPQYSATTAPLRELLKKDATWAWAPACSAAVRQLKSQLTSPPVLAHFDLESPTFVTCDASNTSVGAVLSQLQQGVERPVAFASRSLTPAEQKYSVGEREALACVWACERWHVYLYGRHFTLRTDHQALTALLATSGSGHKPLRIYRWSERLQAYNFTTLFTPGRENVVADLLSRATPSPTPDPSPDTTEPELILMLHTPLQATVSLEDLQLASAQDCTLSQLRTYIREGWPSKVPEELVPFHTLRPCILAMAHEGHLGIVKVKQRCRDLVWWPGLDRDIETMVKDCTACLVSGKTGPPPSPPLQPLQWPPAPWKHIQVDICGEFHGIPQHQRFLIVAYDLHSKWPEVVATGSVTTQVVTDFLVSLFARGINHIRTAFYHPEANGGVERLNQTLKNGLRAHLADGLPFSAALRCTLLHYRATPHSTTGSSPALLMMGRELQLPLDRLRAPTAPAAAPYQSGRVMDRQRRMKQRFDKRRRVRPPPFAVLDWVRVRRPNRNHKLLSFWSTPMQVTDQLGPATFCLADGSRWHASRLRRVAPPSIADPGTGEDFDPTVGDLDLSAEQLQAPAGRPPESAGTQAEPEARPARVRASPSYLRDYVTDF